MFAKKIGNSFRENWSNFHISWILSWPIISSSRTLLFTPELSCFLLLSFNFGVNCAVSYFHKYFLSIHLLPSCLWNLIIISMLLRGQRGPLMIIIDQCFLRYNEDFGVCTCMKLWSHCTSLTQKYLCVLVCLFNIVSCCCFKKHVRRHCEICQPSTLNFYWLLTILLFISWFVSYYFNKHPSNSMYRLRAG